jgi:ATP phosphoribosyltransferase
MTLYAIRPTPGTDSLDDAEVVDQSRYGWRFLEQAVSLWRLVDNSRADEIETIIDRATRAAGDGELRFYHKELEKLLHLLAGIEDAIIQAGIVDQHWRVPAERLEELAKLVPAMDLTTERPLHSKTSALGEVMMNAIFLRNFLSDAAKAGCVVALG